MDITGNKAIGHT